MYLACIENEGNPSVELVCGRLEYIWHALRIQGIHLLYQSVKIHVLDIK